MSGFPRMASSSGGASSSSAGARSSSSALPLRASSENNRRQFGARRNFLRSSSTSGAASGVPKKLKIKGFKRKPKLPENFEDDSWGKLREAIHAVYDKRPIQASREELYRTTEDLCLHKMGPRLYTRLRGEFEAYTRRVVAQLCAVLGDDGGAAGAHIYLNRFSRAWDDFCQETFAVRSIFLYLDRTYVLQSSGAVKSLWALAVQLLRQDLQREPRTLERCKLELLAAIKHERHGESVNRPLLCNLIRMLSTLDIYASDLEPSLMAASSEFYRREGADRIGEMTVPKYLQLVCDRLDEEVDRVSSHLEPQSLRSLIRIVDDNLIREHTSTIVAKGFDVLVDEGRCADLQTLWNLFHRVDAEGVVSGAFGDYVKKHALEIVNDKARDKEMVRRLLTLRGKMQEVLNQSFLGDANCAHAMKTAFEYAINQRQSRPAEMIAKYVDSIMRTGRVHVRRATGQPSAGGASKSASVPAAADASASSGSGSGRQVSSDDELEEELAVIIQLFRYINSKDVFEAFYKKDLAKRLLLNKTASEDLERSMVSRLKTECGADFTSKLEGMFKDMKLSEQAMEGYTAHLESAASDGAPRIKTHVHLLNSGFWPTYPKTKLVVPAVLRAELEHFQQYYTKKHSGRKLAWQHSLGTCVVRARFPRGPKDLSVSLYQAAVLLLFDGKGEGDKLSYKEIQAQLQLEPAELKRTLQSLACQKVHVLRKRPKGTREVLDTDCFVVAHKFKDPRMRIKINQIQIRETVKENQQTHQAISRDREYVIDAAIVRIMKTRKSLSHNELVSEIFQQIRFTAQTTDVKRRIESLIDREYIERDEDNSQQYNYLA